SGGASGDNARGKGFPARGVREGILAPEGEDVLAPAQGVSAPGAMEHADALRLIGIHAEDPASHRAIRDITFAIRPGEILGIAGVEGNGQDVLAAVIVGTLGVSSGQVLLAGRDISGDSVRARAAAGLAHIAEDRLRQALAPDMSLPENLILKAFRSPAFARAGFLRWRAIRAHTERQLERFDVRAGSITAQARHLSGGNQQKLVLAR